MSGFEVNPLRSYLPELAPEEAFSHPLYAAVARNYWEDQSLVALKDAVPGVVDVLTPSEVWKAVPVLDELDAMHNANPSTVFDLWINKTIPLQTCHEADVAQEGVKTLTRIRTLLAGTYANGIARNLYEFELNAAAQSSKIGCSDSAELHDRLRQERGRRQQLADLTEQNKASLAAHGHSYGKLSVVK